jgi:hypothetical protein
MYYLLLEEAKTFKIQEKNYRKTCVQRPPLGPEKSGRFIEVPDKTEI